MKMATLYVFNPEHDLALAANLRHFTSPLAGRQLRAELGWLPALWASESDYILVNDVATAMSSWEHARDRLGFADAPRQFVAKTVLSRLPIDRVDPWGWDLAIKYELLRSGIDAGLLPSDDSLAAIRLLSHRRTAVQLLQQLQGPGLVGQSFEQFDAELPPYPCVIKAPWSSSGRGVRFCDAARLMNSEKLIVNNWMRHVIKTQGSVIVEPYYNKVKDFGMEFYAHADGRVTYLGLSVFATRNGTYLDNIVAPEAEKLDMLTPYVSVDLLQFVRAEICRQMAPIINHRYDGCFGVDMMVVKGDTGYLLHPCVEVNLRRTMGWVALAPRRRGGLLH